MRTIKIVAALALALVSSAALANKYADDFTQINTKIEAPKPDGSPTLASPANTAPAKIPASASPQPTQGTVPTKGSPSVPNKAQNGTTKK